MNKKEVESKLKKGFNGVTPNVCDKVITGVSGLDVNRSHAVSARGNNLIWKIATFCLALVLVVTAVVGGGIFGAESASASTISLDVNPSVQIYLNRSKKVIKVESLNDDGEIIVGKMDFKGCQLEVCVNALIGSMLRNGYLNELANSVLVSVDSNKNVYEELANIVADEITLTLKEMNIDASVVSQWIKTDDVISAIAKNNGISFGKAQLIYKISNQSDYEVEQLVDLSVNELSLLLSNLGITDGDVTQSGSASNIGAEAAVQKALDLLDVDGLTENSEDVTIRNNKLEYGGGVMVYEIEFIYNGYFYEVEIGAVSGRVVKFQKEIIGSNRPDQTSETLSLDRIKAAVFADADVLEENAENLYTVQSGYYRYAVYEISFKCGDAYYEYEIDCYGKTLYQSYELLDISGEDSYLTRNQLDDWFMANNTDGWSKLDRLERYRVTAEKTADGLTYTLQFVSGALQYTYKIDAVNKSILSKETAEYENVVKDNIKDKLHDMFGFGEEFFDEFDKFWEDDDWDFDGDDYDFEFDFGGHHYEFEFDRWGNVYGKEPHGEPKPPFHDRW